MKEKILNTATLLAQQYGLRAFSYQDLSKIVGITKASIHYYFPNKTDLACAILINYTEQFFNNLETYESKLINKSQTTSDGMAIHMQILDYYIDLFRQVALNEDKLCLCFMYASEYLSLDKPLQEIVKKFYIDNETWLAQILNNSQNSNQKTARLNAELIFSALQGLVVRNRIMKNITEFDKITARLKQFII